MKIELPYLDRFLPLEIADGEVLAVVEPNELESAGDPADILRRAAGAPVSADGGEGTSLSAFLEGARSVLVIVNDATRPTPTPAMLDLLLPALAERGIGPDGMAILVATGAHRGPTETEYRQILGSRYDALRHRCLAHDARKEDDLVELGTTRNGTPIVLNRRLFESDRIIATGSVEPHYFAGFTGGRKAFLPGVAAFRTIEANHRLALSPRAHSLALEGNPVHEDMMDALPLLKAPVFALMTVLDKDQCIVAATAGDLIGSFHAAVVTARRIFCVPVPARADVVVSVARFPMDIDLYQSQKAIDNGAIALKDGGTLVLVSSCRDGIGDEAYADLLASAPTPEAAIAKIAEGYRLGYHKAAKMAQVSARSRIVALTELDAGRLRGMFIEPAGSLQEAVDAGLSRARARGVVSPKVLVLSDGCVTVPDPGWGT
ncbi:MAG: nickel-dependent lactate racemase [Spirochaetes bacterium]|nr:nickel-dependent lactate racemase [Spirochaetota bacterium]